MKEINKYLLIFLLLAGALIWGSVRFLQSEKFANIISKRLTKTIHKKFNIKLNFKGIDIGVFPPSTTLKDIRIVNLDKTRNDFEVVSSKIDIIFGFWELMASELTVRELKVSDGIINYDLNKSNNSKENLTYDEFYEIYKDVVFKKMPVRIKNLSFRDVEFELGKYNFSVNELKMGLYRKVLTLEGEVRELLFVRKFLPKEIPTPDSLLFSMHVEKEKVLVKEVKVHSKLISLNYSGGIFPTSDKPRLDGVLSLKGGGRDFVEILKTKMPKLFGNIKGFFDIKIKSNDFFKFKNLKSSLRVVDFQSDIANVDLAEVKFNTIDEVLFVESMNVEVNGGKASLLRKAPLYDINDKKFVFEELSASTKNLHSNDFLYILRDTLGILQGRITGEVDIIYNSELDTLRFRGKKGLILESFRLENPIANNPPIIINPRIDVNSVDVELLGENKVRVDMDLLFPNSHMKGGGVISSERVDFVISDSVIDLKEFGPLAGVQLNGKGTFDINIIGPLEDVKFILNTAVDDFSVININIGRLEGPIIFELGKLKISSDLIRATKGFTEYSGKVDIDFKKKGKLNIDLNVLKGSFLDATEILPTVFEKLTFFNEKGGFNFSGPFKIYGPLSGEGLVVFGSPSVTNLRYYNEDIETLNTKFNYKNEILSITSLNGKKSSGYIKGNGLVNFKTSYFEYDAEIRGLRLKDVDSYKLLNLGFDGDIFAELYGSGTFNDFSTRTQLRIGNGTIGSIKTPDSIVTIYNNSRDLFFSSSVFGQEGTVEGYLNLNDGSNKKPSYINGMLKSSDARLWAGVLSTHNSKDQFLKGNINAKLVSSFYMDRLDKLDFKLDIENLYLNRKNFFLELVPERGSVSIEKGVIKKWDLKLNQQGNDISSVGSGNLFGKYKIEQDFKLHSEVVELLTDRIEKSLGWIEGRHRLIGKANDFQNFFKVTGEDVFLAFKKIQNPLRKINFELIADGPSLILKKFSSEYGKGSLEANGGIEFKLPFPIVNLDFNVENSKVDLLKKSNVVASAKLNLSGSKFPYIMAGSISLLHGNILDELDTLADTAVDSESYKRFLPGEKIEGSSDLIVYDINLDILNPISLKNSLADLKISGGTKIKGPLLRPFFNGEFQVIPTLSKFSFKGHDFILNEGKFTLVDDIRKETPNVEFEGTAKISAESNDYDVKLKLLGKVSDVKIELSSEPPLGREDILSLVTLGVTSEISGNLSEEDRQSVTTLGIGTLLVDRLKLNENLKQGLGINISVQPEFSQDDSSIIEGYTEGDGNTGKIKTSTKIKLQKQISKKVGVSYSSTTGNSNDQKQKVEVDYHMGKNVKGVLIHEIKSSDDEEIGTSTSSGADIIFQWNW